MTALTKYALLEAPGTYFDGQSAEAHEVIVKFGDTSLIIMTMDEMPLCHWSLSGLYDQGAGGDELSLTPDQDSDERLIVNDPDLTAAIREVCPRLTEERASPARRASKRRALIWAAAAVGAVYALIFHIAPEYADRLAPLIPPESEISLGEDIASQFASFISDGEAKFCAAKNGADALAKLTRRLEQNADLPVPLTVRVLDHPLANAFALPGGQIIIFRGLLRKAKNPEAAAGVLAHEIGHIAARDPTRLMLRSASTAGLIGLILGDFAGATIIAGFSEALIHSSHQREAEEAADNYAAALLAKEGLPSRPLAEFFRAMTAEEDGANPPAWLSTHPETGARVENITAKDSIGDQPFTPALEDQDWVALRNICR